MTIINSRSILLYATMGFMRGIAPIRRTTKYLTNCPLVFKPRVKVIDFFKNVLLLWVEPPSWLGKLWSVVSVFLTIFLYLVYLQIFSLHTGGIMIYQLCSLKECGQCPLGTLREPRTICIYFCIRSSYPRFWDLALKSKISTF